MFDFRVVPDAGEAYDVTAGSRDVFTFEKTSRGKNLTTWRDELSMVDLYRLAHIASVRLGLYHGDLKSFEESVELDVDADNTPVECPECGTPLKIKAGVATVDPTRPARTAET